MSVSCRTMCDPYHYHPTGQRIPITYIHGVGNYSNDGVFLRGRPREYPAVLVGPNVAQAKSSCATTCGCGG